jgi:hypothetical protein
MTPLWLRWCFRMLLWMPVMDFNIGLDSLATSGQVEV